MLAKLLPQNPSTIPHLSAAVAGAPVLVNEVKSGIPAPEVRSSHSIVAAGAGVLVNDAKLGIPQPEVRSSHNVVEKRYRMSINDKLGELRELVDGKDSKVQCVHILCLSVCLFLCVCTYTCVSLSQHRGLHLACSFHSSCRLLLCVLSVTPVTSVHSRGDSSIRSYVIVQRKTISMFLILFTGTGIVNLTFN